MAELTLSDIFPDHEDIRTQLEAYLATTDSWKGSIQSQTGRGILNMVSAIGASAQAKIRRKFQDSFTETVISDRASFALTFMQGVRLTRKLPAGALVNLTSAGAPTTIPAYTQFTGGGGAFFNRTALFLDADTPTSVTLFEGDVRRFAMDGIGEAFAMFTSEESGFQVSDLDVYILRDNAPMYRSIGGLFTLRDRLGYVDSTHPEGKLLIQFGDAIYGGISTPNQTLLITYVVTLGADGNNLDTLGKNVTSDDHANVTGVFTSTPTGGANERSALLYKNIAAPTFGMFSSAITKSQYATLAFSYPGVVDVWTFAQREVNPSALEWMNLIEINLLTESPWTVSQQNDFIEYMEDNSAYSPKFIIKTPEPVEISIDLDIYCFKWASPTQAKVNAQNAIETLLSPRPGYLNFDLYLSDIVDKVLESDPGIEYLHIRQPTADTIISGQPIPEPTCTPAFETLTGTIQGGIYYYAIAATMPGGVITTRRYSTVDIDSLWPVGPVFGPPPDADASITVSWEPVIGATTYSVYRRGPGDVGLKLVHTTASTSWVDLGTVVGTDPPPPQNTVPVQYIVIDDLNIVAKYSTRGDRTNNAVT